MEPVLCTGYHVTTPRKLTRYKCTGAILPPVRFWPNPFYAERWARKTGRTVILQIAVQKSYPLPDHRPARWTPEVIHNWKVV